MILINSIVDAWNIFFFEPEPASTIGLVRICLGMVLFIDSFFTWKIQNRYLSDAGVLSYKSWAVLGFENQRFSVFKYCENGYYNNYIFLFYSIFCFFFMVGLYTQISSIVIFFMLLSIHNRNQYIFNSGDTLARLVMFLMIFSRAGEALSMDCYLNSKNQLYTYGEPWCERLIMIQLSVVYAYTSWAKLSNSAWVNGDACYYPISLASYQNYKMPKLLYKDPFISIGSWLTIFIEQSMGFLVWIKDLRYPVLISAIIMHCLFALFLKLEMFSFVMLSLLLIFISPEDLCCWLSVLWK